MTETVQLIGSIVLFLMVPPVNLFVFFYVWRSNWHATLAGRALLYSKLSLLLLVDLSVISVIFGREWPGWPWVRLFVFVAICASQWRLFIALLVVQRRHPDNRYPRQQGTP
jgi:hypothetical protein